MLVSIPARCSLVSSRSLRCASSWDSSPIIVILPWYLLIHFGILWMGEKFLDHVDLIMGNGPCKGPNTMLYLSLKLDHGNLTLTCLWMHMPLGEMRNLMRGVMMIFSYWPITGLVGCPLCWLRSPFGCSLQRGLSMSRGRPWNMECPITTKLLLTACLMLQGTSSKLLAQMRVPWHGAEVQRN